MALTQFNWLSLRVLLSEVVGSPALILLLSLSLVTWLCIRFNVSGKATLLLNGLVLFAVLGFTFNQGWLVIVALLVSMLLYGAYALFWSK